jgi:hypothetical protein
MRVQTGMKQLEKGVRVHVSTAHGIGTQTQVRTDGRQVIFHFDDASSGLDCRVCSSKDEATFKSTSLTAPGLSPPPLKRTAAVEISFPHKAPPMMILGWNSHLQAQGPVPRTTYHCCSAVVVVAAPHSVDVPGAAAQSSPVAAASQLAAAVAPAVADAAAKAPPALAPDTSQSAFPAKPCSVAVGPTSSAPGERGVSEIST